MIPSETVPNILTWPEIRDHIRLTDDYEKDSLLNKALGCVTTFENETNVAAGLRTISVDYTIGDLHHYGRCFACGRSVAIPLPKGPVIKGTVTVNNNGTMIDPTTLQLSKVGHIWSVHVPSLSYGPVTVTYQAGYAVVPEDIKQAVLIHTETLYRNRGALSAQQQYELSFGLRQTYNNYCTFKALAG